MQSLFQRQKKEMQNDNAQRHKKAGKEHPVKNRSEACPHEGKQP